MGAVGLEEAGQSRRRFGHRRDAVDGDPAIGDPYGAGHGLGIDGQTLPGQMKKAGAGRRAGEERGIEPAMADGPNLEAPVPRGGGGGLADGEDGEARQRAGQLDGPGRGDEKQIGFAMRDGFTGGPRLGQRGGEHAGKAQIRQLTDKVPVIGRRAGDEDRRLRVSPRQ